MSFLSSKIIWLILNPFNLIILLIVLGVFLHFIKFKQISIIAFFASFILFFISGVVPTGSYLLYVLEKKFHNTIVLPENIDGILILSGPTDPFLSREHNQISLNGSAERLTESIHLIKNLIGLFPISSIHNESLSYNFLCLNSFMTF